MDLDDFKTHWAAYNQKVEQNLALTLALWRETRWQKTRSALQKQMLAAGAELVMGVAAAVALSAFLGAHLMDWPFLLPALALQVFVLFQTAFSAYQIIQLRALDFTTPVLMSQTRLAHLRRRRLQVTMWTFGLAPLLWVPLLIVMLKGLLGVNAYLTLAAGWLWANLLFGLAVAALTWWVARRRPANWQSSPRWQAFLDDVAGRSLSEANGFLRELAAFEREG